MSLRVFQLSPAPFSSHHQIVGTVDTCSSLAMMYMGFKHYTTPKWFRVFPPRPLTFLSRPSADPYLPYWYRPHRSTTKLPILFIHGIGVRLPSLSSYSHSFLLAPIDWYIPLHTPNPRTNRSRPRRRHHSRRAPPHLHAHNQPPPPPSRNLPCHLPHPLFT